MPKVKGETTEKKVAKREAHIEQLGVLFAPYIGKPMRFKIITDESGEAHHDFPITVTAVEVQNLTGFTLVDKRTGKDKNYKPPLARIVTNAGNIVVVVEDIVPLAVSDGIEIRAGEYKYRFEEVQ